MERQNKGLFALMLILTLTVCVMSVGFAASAYTAALSINGTATVRSAQWKVEYDKDVYTESGNVAATTKEVTGTTFTFDVTLEKPGDVYETTLKVKNSGTMKAKLTDIVVGSTLTDAQKKYVKYTVNYAGLGEIETNTDYDSILAAGSSADVVVRVEYLKAAADDLPTDDQENIKLTGTLNFEQVD